MLNKILNVHKLVSFAHCAQPKPVAPPPPEVEEEQGAEPSSAALRIVQVGGTVECYYMAIPAARFQASLVQAEEILTPGDKLLLVPKRTVRKLRKRIRKQSDGGEASISGNLFAKRNSRDGDSVGARRNKHEVRKYVRFFGIDRKNKEVGKTEQGITNKAPIPRLAKRNGGPETSSRGSQTLRPSPNFTGLMNDCYY